MKKLLAIIFVLAFLVTLTACTKADNNSLIGTWYCAEEDITITFGSDGICKLMYNGRPSIGPYVVEQDRYITITWKGETEIIDEYEEIENFEYKIESGAMTLMEDDDYEIGVFVRK